MTALSQVLRLKFALAGSVLGLAAMMGAPAIANESDPTIDLDTLRQYGLEGQQLATPAADQVTSVSQLSDVSPTDWAFQALQ